jgi:hypothetical protein
VSQDKQSFKSYHGHQSLELKDVCDILYTIMLTTTNYLLFKIVFTFIVGYTNPNVATQLLKKTKISTELSHFLLKILLDTAATSSNLTGFHG